MVGTRKVLSKCMEEQPNGKLFEKWEMGEYEWKSYSKVDEMANDFGKGLRELGTVCLLLLFFYIFVWVIRMVTNLFSKVKTASNLKIILLIVVILDMVYTIRSQQGKHKVYSFKEEFIKSFFMISWPI